MPTLPRARRYAAGRKRRHTPATISPLKKQAAASFQSFITGHDDAHFPAMPLAFSERAECFSTAASSNGIFSRLSILTSPKTRAQIPIRLLAARSLSSPAHIIANKMSHFLLVSSRGRAMPLSHALHDFSQLAAHKGRRRGEAGLSTCARERAARISR